MNSSQSDSPDPAGGGEEPAGAERYLHPGEELRICSSDVQIKKFRFEAYLTNRRLFLIDQNDRKPGVTAKEVPVGSNIGSYLEYSPTHEPVIVLSVKTADDDIRTMKMTFAHTGEERTREATLDLVCRMCPLHLLEPGEMLKCLKKNQILQVLTDYDGALEDIPAWCKKCGQEFRHRGRRRLL